MKSISALLLFNILFARISYSSDFNWQTITPPNSIFSFQFPRTPTVLSENENETLYDGMLSNKSFIHFVRHRLDSTFQYYIDSIIRNTEGFDSSFELNHSLALDTLRNPIYSYKSAISNNYNDFQLMEFDTIGQTSDSTIRGGHLSFSTSNSEGAVFIFIKILIKENEIYCFSVESNTSNLTEANLAKETYFESIDILRQ